MTATALISAPATARPRRLRAKLTGISVATTGAVYLAASAAGIDFRLTDPQATQAHHLVLPEIAVFTLLFAGLGWATLAVLERLTRHAKAVTTALATAVLLLSFVPIGLETATAGTKTMLTVIHLVVFAVMAVMLRTTRR